MLNSHRLQIQAAELRSKINGMTETRENKPEYDELRAKLSKLDKDVAVAIGEEDEDMDKAMAENNGRPFGQTAETRELRSLAGRVALTASFGRLFVDGEFPMDLSMSSKATSTWTVMSFPW